MERMRTSALNEYDSFYDSVLDGLKDISEMQEEALSYWLKNGNLVHHCEKLTKYPNVSLTCECTELDFGNIFVCINTINVTITTYNYKTSKYLFSVYKNYATLLAELRNAQNTCIRTNIHV